MIVYGDPQYAITTREAGDRLREYLRRAEAGGLDAARDLVIALGQVEQGIADFKGEDSSCGRVAAIMQATDFAASHFVRVLSGDVFDSTGLEAVWSCAEVALRGERELNVKVPEGFAFYCLYPEQYVRAADEYAKKNRGGVILVAGIRSIGTTLSAVVTATLRARVLDARRITVRPTGHPFARQSDLAAAPPAGSVVIVDEGPGLSGSSMASVASAFRARGIMDITFFPSHANPPGNAASEETKRIWAETKTIVHPLLDAEFQKSGVLASLRVETERLFKARVVKVDDLSCGKWRDYFQGGKNVSVTPPLERSKYLVTAENGARVLWKYAGLGPGGNLEPVAERAWSRQKKLAADGWCSPPLAESYGFIGTEFHEGKLLRAGDLNDAMMRHLARYIVSAGNIHLSQAENLQSLKRLEEMVRCNFEEAGEVSPEIGGLAALAESIAALPSYGDGRLAPHEWVNARGRRWKTDVWGHELDHTYPGVQSILWDMAGAIVEWKMSGSAKAEFLRLVIEAGIQASERTLELFQYGYIAFRMGMCSLVNDSEGVAFYRDMARRLAAARG